MLRVLAIDDEEEITRLIERALTSAGFNVEVASNGREGIERFNERFFDIVITDSEMPYLNGCEVLEYIRRSNRPDTPVIGISATPWQLSGQDFNVILSKPFSLKTLLDRLDEISYDVMVALLAV